MFAYNPAVTDRSGEILANAMSNASALQLEGMQSLGNAFANLGESAAKAYEKASENKMTSDYLDSMAGYYNQTKDLSGNAYMDNETLEKFTTMPLGKKTGVISALKAKEDYDLKRWMYQTQYNNAANRIQLNSANQAALRQPAPNQRTTGRLPQDIDALVQ